MTATLQNPFNDNMLGLFTFLRTYARRHDNTNPNSTIESWSECVARVVNAFNDQLNIGFTREELAEIYDLIYTFKCSVSGRFLWQLGTENLARTGLTSLQNCAHVALTEPIQPFTWTMNMLMLGAGVGYRLLPDDVSNFPPVKHVAIERKDVKDADFIVPDSREGWVKLLGKLLKAHHYTGQGFSFSCLLLRSKGAPIKGFGGVSSGPEVLCSGIFQINKILNKCAGRKLRPIDCLDIMNIIGQIVVSGNVRRCLPEGALVHGEQGLFPIQDMRPGMRVITTNGYARVTDAIRQGVQSTVRVYTECGYLECTPSHRVAILTRDNCIEWKRAGDLTKKDVLICTRTAVPGTPTTAFGAPLTPKMAWLIGFIQQYSINMRTLNIHEEIFFIVYHRIAKQIERLLKEVCESFSVVRHAKDKWYKITCTDKAFLEHVRVIVDRESEIPPCILHGLAENRVAYLAGIGDGSGFRRKTLVKSHDEQFVKNVQRVAFSCGLETYMYRSRRIFYITVSRTAKALLENPLFRHNRAAVLPENDHFYPGVVCIEHAREVETYDISVQGDNEFFCDGYLVHNSAQIAIGDCMDTEFLHAKRWDMECIPDWRQFSNNSVVCNDISKILDNEEFWAGYNGNGEPYGLINLDLSRKCGRLGETQYPDPNVSGYNPCFAEDTLVYLADGRGAVPISMLAWEEADVQLFSFNPITGDVEQTVGRSPRITGDSQKLLRIWFAPKEYIDVTPNHKFFVLTKQGQIEARNLEPGDMLPMFCIGVNSYSRNVFTQDGKTVQKVEELDGLHMVYNITVPKNHTLAVITSQNVDGYEGVFACNCGEQSLDSMETCCLGELFLPNISSFEELEKCTRYIYRICKHSLLLPAPDCKETEAVVHRNMRMGIGVTGYLQASEEKRRWLSTCYERLRAFDNEYSAVHGMPRSIKLTTCKPSGTLSLLAGCTPGVHPGFAQEYIRRIRISSQSPLVEIAKSHGYPVEYARRLGDNSIDHTTQIVSFPTRLPEGAILAENCSAIEQLEWVKRMQTEWSDNSVSVTVYYRKHELPAIKEWLSKHYNDSIKSVSFLLHSDHGFAQAPMEKISREEYEALKAKCRPIVDMAGVCYSSKDEELAGADCPGGVCPVK
jgi:hypothetical protein